MYMCVYVYIYLYIYLRMWLGVLCAHRHPLRSVPRCRAAGFFRRIFGAQKYRVTRGSFYTLFSCRLASFDVSSKPLRSCKLRTGWLCACNAQDGPSIYINI